MNHVFGLVFSVMESVETTRDCCITPEFNTNQCIFYPVKEEEREVLLGATHTSRGSLSPEGSGATHQLDCQTADHTLRESLLFLVIFPIHKIVLKDLCLNVLMFNNR